MTLSAPDERSRLLTHWLLSLPAGYGLDPAALAPASTDASFRRYFRVPSVGAPGGAFIAVDAPPPEKCREFAQVAGLLRDAGVHVPQVLETDFEQGFMLVTDLGRAVYVDALKRAGAIDDGSARALMRDALAALLRWQQASHEGVLPAFDEAFIRREMALMPQWYLGRHLGLDSADYDRAGLERVFDTLTRSALGQPHLYMHRDFMPRNLMVSAPNPGVLDFQDAVWGPMTYDVVSLFRDAFLSWEEEFELDGFAWYWERARRAGLPVREDFAEFYRELEWMGLQRHLKVLGLFARIHYRDGKPRYLADLPRFVGYARKVAERYRELAPLARLLDAIESRAAQVRYTF
jgi:aminoglycoside/choline kinase family phosphotransferase